MAFRRIDAEGVLGGRYRLQHSIASGGMAEVWEAHDDILGRRVAVKVLHSHLATDASFLARFRREAIAAARLAHPNVVATYDTGVDDGVAWIVMERVDGNTLRQVLSASGPFSPGRAVHIAIQVADALDYAHRAGVIHRDVKPANILLTESDRVKVADFGIAKAAIEAAEDAGGSSIDFTDLTQSGAIVGTAKYLSPEQVNGENVDGRSDVYALGVVLYEMLCGQVPFTGETDVAVAVQHATATPRPPRQVRDDIPGSLEVVVLKALAKLPDERYPSAGALHAALLSIDVRPDDPDHTMVERGTQPALRSGTQPALRSGTQPGPSTAVQPRDPPTDGADTPVGGARLDRTRRSRLLPALVALVAIVTLAVVGILFARSDTGQRLLHPPSKAASTNDRPVTIVSSAAFDPSGDGSEHDADVANLTDGNPSTTWSTEQYGDGTFGGLKTGVGVIVTLNGPHKLGALQVTSPTRGWSAEVHVANEDSLSPPPDGWGEAVATRTDINGNVTFGLDGKTGSKVLLWITNLGDSGTVTVSDLHLTA